MKRSKKLSLERKYELEKAIMFGNISINELDSSELEYVKNSINGIEGKFSIKQGTYIQNVVVIAGKGVRRDIDDIKRLVREHKKENGEETSPKDWQKVTGIAIIDVGKGEKAEVHWYQCKDVGKVEFKIKRWL